MESGGVTGRDDVYLSVYQASAVMRMSKHIVYELIRRGELEAEREGRAYRISERAIVRALKTRGQAGE